MRCLISISSVALSYVDVWNNGDFDALDGIIHPDYRARRGDRLMASGAAALEAWLSGLHDIFPDMKYTVEEIFTVDDRVVVRASGIGTHLGEWRNKLFTVPPTGRRVTWSGVHQLSAGSSLATTPPAQSRVGLAVVRPPHGHLGRFRRHVVRRELACSPPQ